MDFDILMGKGVINDSFLYFFYFALLDVILN